MEPLVSHHMDSQNFDDWTQLDGLFRPDTDFDLALYKDGLDFADSHQVRITFDIIHLQKFNFVLLLTDTMDNFSSMLTRGLHVLELIQIPF